MTRDDSLNQRPGVIVRAASMVLGLFAGLCLGLFLLMIVRHGWAWQYLVLLVLAGILAGSVRLPGHIRVNLTLVLCSLAFSCYLAEVVLASKLVPQQLSFIGAPWLPRGFGENASATKMQIEFAKQQHVEFDTRNRLSVIMDLRQRGADAWPQVPNGAMFKDRPVGSSVPALAIDGVSVMPLGGVADKVTVYCNESGQYTIYESDEHGFHNPRGIWAASEFPIAAVGDSFVLGGCVSTDKNFVALLRQRYPNTLNVGRAGNGPLSELASIKEYLSVVKPKIVFWCYYEANDLAVDLPREQRNPIYRAYMNATFSQGLVGRQAAIDQALMAYIDKVEKAQTLLGRVQNMLAQPPNVEAIFEQAERTVKLTSLRETLTSLLGQGSGKPGEHDLQASPPVPEETISLFRNVLEEAQRSIQAWGGTMVFVYLPQWERYVDVKYASKDRDTALAVVRSLGMPIIDIHLAFAAHPDPVSLFPLRWRGHYTEEGHRMVAEELIRFSSRQLGVTQVDAAVLKPVGTVVR
ncbi:MAG: hypothetical protein JJE16_06180 [Nitrospiraceae bacterium]|nr:hypothetical protein [Nitrospiraceae bacterium]